MQALPVIIGFGGINAGGRSSFHQSYRRTVLESLQAEERHRTLAGLACLMGLVQWSEASYRDEDGEALSTAEVAERYQDAVIAGTLVRRIDGSQFDPDNATWQRRLTLSSDDEAKDLSFILPRNGVPDPLPAGWTVEVLPDNTHRVTVNGPTEVLLPSTRELPVKAGGQVPTGFNPATLYNSRYQPRGLQMALFGATDALRSTGIEWDHIAAAVHPDEVGVYASSCYGQLDDEGWGGMLRARAQGSRPSAKQAPMSLNTMPADFINAYVLGSVGHTEAVTGACATFLYNLRAGIEDIKAGRRRVAIVGCSEAPILPDVLESYANMGALATDDALAKLDGVERPDWRRASRPFGDNCGFTMGEASQYIIITDDALAIELGADIHAAATDVFINADGIKKSISGPGPGNYITFAKAVAAAAQVVGMDTVRQRSFVQAHGSSTPQNRVTESAIFDRVAEAFDIRDWPVVAVKAFFGHTMGTASGDQVANSLGIFRYGILPGIKTVDRFADDIFADRLALSASDRQLEPGQLAVAFINAKGFGGNNATAVLLSPQQTEEMLARRHSDQWNDYVQRREAVRHHAADYEASADQGELTPLYRFGEPLMDEADVQISCDAVALPGYTRPVLLPSENPWADMV